MKRIHLIFSILAVALFELRYLICSYTHLKLNGYTFVTSPEMIHYACQDPINFGSWLQQLNKLHEIEVTKWWGLSGKINSAAFVFTASMSLDTILFWMPIKKHKYSKLFIDMLVTFAIGDIVDRIWFNINTFTVNDYVLIWVVVLIFIWDIMKLKGYKFRKTLQEN